MHRRFVTFTLSAAALALGTGVTTAHASTAIGTDQIYVSTHGSDSNPCTQALPCATLQFAVDNAPAGSLIHVAAGTYNQTVNITEPLTIAGAGAGKTIIDGSNIDTEVMSPAYFGVISVENNSGAGGAIDIRGLTVKNAFITEAEYENDADPSDIIVYNDANAGDTINVSGVAFGAVQNASEFTGVGFDTFNDAASVSFTTSSVTGVFQGALLEGGGIGGHVTVTGVNFNHLGAMHRVQRVRWRHDISGRGPLRPQRSARDRDRHHQHQSLRRLRGLRYRCRRRIFRRQLHGAERSVHR